MSIKDEALRYANWRWPVFPLHDTVSGDCSCGKRTCPYYPGPCECGTDDCCRSPGKHPRTPHGLKDATTDRSQIEEWWQRWPNANLGIRTGEVSGITVLDLDNAEVPQRMRNAGVEPPKTYCVKTPRGWHLYVTYRESLKQTQKLIPGLDIRNDGGYVVAPPSVVFGTQYRVSWDKEIIEFKGLDGAQRQLDKPGGIVGGTDADMRWISDLMESGATHGTRNQSVFQLACYLRSKAISRDIAYTVLSQFAQRCDPPLGHNEVLSTLESAWRYSPTNAINYEGNTLPPPIADVTSPRRHVYRWPDAGITVELDRLKVSDHGIECWITIATHDLGTVYGPIRIDLLSSSKRDEVRRRLQERVKYDWAAILQHIAYLVIHSQDDDEPFLDIAKHTPNDDGGYLLYPFVRRAQPTVLFSDGGEGKSTLACALALSVATGVEIVPGFKPERTGRTLYLDWEANEDDVRQMLDGIAAGADITIPEDMILYRHLGNSLAANSDSIIRRVSEWEIDLIIVDSLIGSAGEDVYNTDAARAYFRLMRESGAASIGITHITKEGGSKPYGSAFYFNLARTVWRLKREEGESETASILGLFHEKQNRGKRLKPLGLKVYQDDAGTVAYEAADLEGTDMLQEHGKLTTADRIASALEQNGPMTVDDLAKYLGMGHQRDTIKRTLNRNVKRFAKRLSTGDWMLATQRFEPQVETPGRVPGQVSGTRPGTVSHQHRDSSPPLRGDGAVSRADEESKKEEVSRQDSPGEEIDVPW